MKFISVTTFAVSACCLSMLSACSSERNLRFDSDAVQSAAANQRRGDGGSLFDIFRDGGSKVKVNRFLWTASLQVLDFLPVENADPFTGVISTGFGRPPGGGQVYRATILISDTALDARSLNVALQTRGGAAVSTATQRAVEDAILTRARQLRVQAKSF